MLTNTILNKGNLNNNIFSSTTSTFIWDTKVHSAKYTIGAKYLVFLKVVLNFLQEKIKVSSCKSDILELRSQTHSVFTMSRESNLDSLTL